MPVPPPPPGGPPPPPALSQSSRCPPTVGADRGALLSDICRGTRLRKVTEVNDRSAPQLHQSRPPTLQTPSPAQTPPLAHSPLDKPKVGEATVGAANGSGATSPSGSAPPIGGLFPGGVPKLRASADGSSGRAPRAAAPRPPSQRHDDVDSPALSSAPLPQCRRGNAPSPPVTAYNREKPLPPTPPSASKPRPPTSGGNPAPCSLAPPPPQYHGNGAESSPDLPQRQNSLNKRPAPSPTGHTPTRGPAPPPPSPAHNRPTPTASSPSHQATRPAPPSREPPPRAAAPPAPVMSSPRPGCREAPPPPPGRTHGSPAPSDPPSRGKPPPPPRTPAAPPPPPPSHPHRNGPCSPRIRIDDFESKYSFHPLDDFPPPEEYRHFTKIYPSKANRVMRGAPPLPPVAR
ncbi:WAS/WASL-interacting protein family member 2-like isoform X2 [Periophthalmus magnuspinnatus]|uniref:WAS/WASL-interacting protein family member 2-like isoform X2 n=1 Tax=Periophthalmus magnuspinnatus TaxID=409849 RepID=UPI002436714B|nr:WAS/WASL-interacting protein family member 2-like isoform X2 [Periophthalmus magnuspinnatus]